MGPVDSSRAGTGRADLVAPPVADDFVLSGPTRTVTGAGAASTLADPAAAADLARRIAAGRSAVQAPGIVGALAFDHDHPAALTVPERLRTAPGPWRAPTGLPALPATTLTRELPGAAEHHDRVRRLIARVRAGELDKVVAARSVLFTAERPLSRSALLARLVAQDPAGHGFAVDLSAAGAPYRGRALVGASPETLVARTGARVTARPLAGSAPRAADPGADAAVAEALLTSTKNLDEHRMVVDWMREVLGPLCTELTVPERPELISTPDLWHLATPISGRLADPERTTALDLAIALHPTPAVCGTPQRAAMTAIAETEEDRGFYAGAVGWCDAAGDGEWMVAIRCAELSADRRSVRAYAGGGIVADSDPQDEYAETETKLKTLLAALAP